jgi:hypothetical protein
MTDMTDERELDDVEFPSLPKRLLMAFISPGKLGEHLSEHPRWVAALLVSTALIVLGTTLIPADVFLEAQRAAILERGGEVPAMPERAMQAMRVVVPVVTALSTGIFTFVFAGLYTVIFAFVLGDQGRYVQYLAVLAHAWFIAAVFALALTPLRISTGNPQFTVNLASFFFFLPEGYLLNVLRALDLSQIWSTLVFAQGAHAIDSRRSFGSAAGVGLTVVLAFALIVANFL